MTLKTYVTLSDKMHKKIKLVQENKTLSIQLDVLRSSSTCVISVIFLLAIDRGGNKVKNEILDAVISIIMMKTEQ